jgi:DNA-binding transcriptional LysR family regulator
MKLRQIEVFREVCEAGSVTGAAESLGISQPAVSKHLAALERACGFLLFSRTGGRLVRTPEGRLFALEVERLFQNIGRLEHIARAIAERRRGSVRIAAFPALSNRFLPAVLAPLLAERTEMRLSLESRTSPRIVEMAMNQGIDLGLSLLPAEHPLVECTCICEFELVCVLQRRHWLSSRSSIGPAELRDEPFVSLGAADRSRTIIDEAFGLKHPRSRMQIEAQMAEAACSFVANGLGVAIVPPFVVKAFAGHDLISRPFRPPVRMKVWEFVPTANPVAAITRELASSIRKALRQYQCGLHSDNG